jgi:Zn-dependent M28 family amino/carboxypeptidase
VLLTLAEILSQNKHHHTLEFIAFTGEEGAGLGDMEYDRRTANFDRVTTAINIDGVGPYTGTTTITSFVASQEFEKLLDQKLENFPGVIKVEPWPASDHYIFYSHGTPSLALTSKGIQGIYHTQADTLAWISGDKLAEATRLVLDLFEELDHKDLAWSRPTK